MVFVKKTDFNSILVSPKTLVALKLLLAIICLYFAIYFLVLKDKIAEDEANWQKTKATNTLAAYQNYYDSYPVGKYHSLATDKIILLKQDALNYDQAIAAGTYQALEHYINTCENTGCKNLNQVQKTLDTADRIIDDFKYHLRVKNLSTGSKGFALADIDNYKKILPQDSKIEVWQQLVGENFLSLAHKSLTQKDLNQASIYATKAEKLLGKSKAKDVFNLIKEQTEQNPNENPPDKPDNDNPKEPTEDTSSEAKLKQIDNALIEGDIDLIKFYINNCSDCPRAESAKTKLASYENIQQDFNNNLNNNRLTKGKNYAAKNLVDLKKLFKNSKQIPIWTQKISDAFYVLAADESDSKKSLAYIKTGLKFAVDAEKLNSLKTSSTTKHSNQQNYKAMQQAKTIKSAEKYIANCQAEVCSEYKKTKAKLADAKSIGEDFSQHIKNTALTKGVSGYAMDDIAKLKSLFANDPVIEQWESEVINKFLSLVDGALKTKQYAKARRYLASALGIQNDNPELNSVLRELSKVSPQYSIYTKGSNLVPAMIYLPGKKFKMGGSFKRSKPKHLVKIKQFKISKNEISFQKYLQFAEETNTKTNSSNWGLGNRPAINVSWHDATNYGKWLSKKTGRKFRLPTEAEWEYAASKSKILDRNHKFNKNKLCQYANGADKNSSFPWKNHKCNDGYRTGTAPTASFKSNSFGLNDTAGNVWEWTADCWHYNFKGAPKTAQAWISNGDCRYRVIKGGGWNSSAKLMSPKYRTSAKAQIRYNYVGFRIVEEL